MRPEVDAKVLPRTAVASRHRDTVPAAAVSHKSEIAVRPTQCPLCPHSDQVPQRSEMTRCAKNRPCDPNAGPQVPKNILKTERWATMSENDRSAKVLLLNDDQTTMEFVVQVLESIFGKTRDEALKLVLAIHRDGSGECGVYTPELASKIAERVAELARRNGYPLRCIVEPSPNA